MEAGNIELKLHEIGALISPRGARYKILDSGPGSVWEFLCIAAANEQKN